MSALRKPHVLATTCTIHDVTTHHIRQLSSHERRVTCQWCHMGAHPRHYNTPPIGAHPRGRLLDGARATFTDHATPEDVYHRHAPCVATAPAKATILLGHFCSLPHGPGHTELCIMLARASRLSRMGHDSWSCALGSGHLGMIMPVTCSNRALQLSSESSL